MILFLIHSSPMNILSSLKSIFKKEENNKNLFTVRQYRGSDNGFRYFGTNLDLKKAQYRYELIKRIFDEYNNPKIILNNEYKLDKIK